MVILKKQRIKHGYDPDSKTKGGYTALMGAAMNGHLDIVNTLLDVGANPDIKFKAGRTALFGAVHQGQA